METIAATFPLPWSHYVRLMTVASDAARRFYETEALRGGWTIRQLDRQISSAFYERTAASRSKLTMLTKNNRQRAGDRVTPDEQLKDPFLLELGSDFTFVGRQTHPAIDRFQGPAATLNAHRLHPTHRCLNYCPCSTLSPFSPNLPPRRALRGRRWRS